MTKRKKQEGFVAVQAHAWRCKSSWCCNSQTPASQRDEACHHQRSSHDVGDVGGIATESWPASGFPGHTKARQVITTD